MSILKMRDENGTIHSIAIMKGDKGDGVPDGGTTGQVIKKTEDGTEWGDTGVPDGGSAGQVLKKTESGTAWGDVDISSKCETLLTNTDVSVNSYTIEKRGLYEVKMFYSTADRKSSLTSGWNYLHYNTFLVSVSDFDQEQWVASLALVYMDNGVPKFRKAGIQYKNKTFTAVYKHVIVDDTGVEEANNDDRAYLAEVKLIIPYE